MNIGIDIKAFKNGSTGIARYLRNIMDQLQKLDSANTYNLFECTASDYKITNRRWKKVLIPWKLPGIFWQQLLLPFALKKHAIDILWAPEQICPVWYSGTVFTTVHDLTALRYPASCQKTNYFIQKYLFPLTIKRSKLLLPVSDFIGREVLQWYPELATPQMITTVTNGSPDWKFHPHPQDADTDPYLFFAGNLEPRKNLIRLIEALEILQSRGITLPLHLAGPPGWKNSEIHRKIEQSPVGSSISFLGYLSEDELEKQYRNSAAVIYPSLYEGFGLPVLEALSTGTRIITSRATVMEEIAGPFAHYFNPNDSDDIARTIGSALKQPPPDHTCQEVLQRYTWEKSARKLLELFITVR